jgi:hypothetical protein
MLVDHDPVVAQLVHILALVEVALEKPVGQVGIKVAVGESQSQRRILVPFFVGIFMVRILAEIAEFHLDMLPAGTGSANSRTGSVQFRLFSRYQRHFAVIFVIDVIFAPQQIR